MNKISFISLALLGLMVSPAYADTNSTTVKVNTSVVDTCSLSTPNVVFGNYDPLANSDQLTTQNVSITCTKGTAWNFYEYAVYYAYSGGTNSTGYASAMISNGNKLYYQVQMSDGVWDNDVDMGGRPNSGHYLGTGTGSTQPLTLNYRIIKNQYVAPGSYVDTATAYVAF